MQTHESRWSSGGSSPFHHIREGRHSRNRGEDGEEGPPRSRHSTASRDLDKGVSIHLQREYVRGPSHTALRTCRPDDEVEDLQFPEDGHRDHDDRHRLEEGERDTGKHPEGGRPIDLGRFPVVLWNCREPGRIDDETEAGPEPHGTENEAEQEGRRPLHPSDRETLDAEGAKEFRHNPNRAVVDVEHQDAADDERGHHPDENRSLHPRRALHVSEDESKPEAKKQAQREMDADPDRTMNQRSERRRFGESVQVDRIRTSEHLPVVRQSREPSVGGKQAYPDRRKDGIGNEQEDEDHRRREEHEPKRGPGSSAARLSCARPAWARPKATKEFRHSLESQSSHYAGTFASIAARTESR